MKFLFIVRGEGRGHFTQTITLEEILLRNRHEVVEVLIRKSSTRALPGFFSRSIHAPAKRFISPNFLPTADNKRANLTKNFTYNLLRLPEYLRNMYYISQRVREVGAEVVISSYELLTGFAYALFHPSVPCICVEHQYLFLHRGFEFPDKGSCQLWMLRFFIRMTALRSSKKLALSFLKVEQDDMNQIMTIPPLIRQEVTAIHPKKGDYIHGYMISSGFADSVENFHVKHTEVPLTLSWGRSDAKGVTRIDETLSFHQTNDVKLLNAMAGYKAYASTAGFESICETICLGKPVLMVPAHIEQGYNTHGAVKAGARVINDSFDLQPLLRFAREYTPNRRFVYWVRNCECWMIRELEKLAASHSEVTLIPTFTNYLPI